MKKSIIFFLVIILVGIGIAAGIYLFSARLKPEQAFRANLTDAQKMLVMLCRAEKAYHQSSKNYEYISAKKSGGKTIYSQGWSAMKLPDVEENSGFDYECIPAEGGCRANEVVGEGLSGNGIQIDIESGAYTCFGSYKPVTTEGFDGTLVTVACQA